MQNCIVLGLDNSTTCTGWSIISYQNDAFSLVDYGMIKREKKGLQATLVKFEQELINIINTYHPGYISAEQMFIGSNATTGIRLAYIHGVMLLVATKSNIPVVYYSPMTLKSQTLHHLKAKNINRKKENGEMKTGNEMKEEVHSAIVDFFGKSCFQKEYTIDVTDSISAALTFIYNDGKEVLSGKKLKQQKAKEEKLRLKEEQKRRRQQEREERKRRVEEEKEKKRKEREERKRLAALKKQENKKVHREK